MGFGEGPRCRKGEAEARSGSEAETAEGGRWKRRWEKERVGVAVGRGGERGRWRPGGPRSGRRCVMLVGVVVGRIGRRDEVEQRGGGVRDGGLRWEREMAA